MDNYLHLLHKFFGHQPLRKFRSLMYYSEYKFGRLDTY